MMNRVALLIGGNQGDRQRLIEEATALIAKRIGAVLLASHIHETEPWGDFGGERPPAFLNRALLVATALGAHEVLREALAIESDLGRVRPGDVGAGIAGACAGLRAGVECSPETGELSEGLRGGRSEECSERYSMGYCTPSPLRGTPPVPGGELGRTYHSRTMDIDLIFWNDEVIDTPDLQIPHPRAHQRRFVLEPLAEIMPDYKHPLLGLTVSEMLSRLDA